MKKEAYVVFDLETTGLDVQKSTIIEIGAIKVRDGEVVDKFSEIINPHQAVEQKILELTNITTGMLKKGKELEQVVPEFLKFSEGYTMVGHNISFDYKFMKTAAVKLKLSFERKGIDTLQIARKCLKELSSKKLSALCEYYQYQNLHEHRALDDTKATQYIYERLKQEFQEKEPKVFEAKNLEFKPQKQEKITEKQKKYLEKLVLAYHITIDSSIEELSKGEAARLIDRILFQYGRLVY